MVTRTQCLLVLLALVVVGCEGSGSQRKRMEGAQAPNWPALQALNDQGGMMTVGMALQMQGPAAAKKAAAAPEFKKLLDDFEATPIPSQFSNSARETAKKELVESLRKLPEAGSDAEAKELWEKARAAMQTLTTP